MVALLPDGIFPQIALAGILVGLALVFRRGVPKAYGLGLVMMGVFLLDVATRGSLQRELAFAPARLADTWWSPLTSAFLHAPPSGLGGFFNIHLIANLFILLTAGPALEDRVGERRFLVIFFAAHAAALVSHVLLAFVIPQFISLATPALGASGGIFGVLTAFAVRYPRAMLPMLLLFFIFRLRASIVLLIYLGFNVAYFLGDFYSRVPSGIGWWGHFAGFFVGLAFARTLPAMTISDVETRGSTRGLPDPEKLAPLATTPETKRLLERVRQFDPDSRTAHDSTFALAWVDKMLEKARCPAGHGYRREGLVAVCEGGESKVDFARK